MTKLQILSPIVHNEKGTQKDVLSNIKSQGFERVRIDGEIMRTFAAGEEAGMKIHIGTENLCDGLEECSIITMPFSVNENEAGSIILVGPTRMNYRATVPLLEYVAKSMKKIDKR